MAASTSIELPPLALETVEIPLIGTSPLIVHAWSEKALRAMADNQQKKATKAREARRAYTSTAYAMSDADLRKQVVQRAWADFEALRKRHAGLSELARIFEAIDQARPAE